MLRILTKGIWSFRGNMVISRPAKNVDSTDPIIDEADVWVELHGILVDAMTIEGIKWLMRKIGFPLSEVKTFLYAGRRVYKQKLKVKISDPLKYKIPMNHEVLGKFWVYVVFEGMMNICMFCATVGHEYMVCPVKTRMMEMQSKGQFIDQIGSESIPEQKVGLWVNNKTMVPRDDAVTTHNNDESSQTPRASTEARDKGLCRTVEGKKLKRTLDLNNGGVEMVVIEGRNNTQTEEGQLAENLQINYKRAREANPNSPSSSQ